MTANPLRYTSTPKRSVKNCIRLGILSTLKCLAIFLLIFSLGYAIKSYLDLPLMYISTETDRCAYMEDAEGIKDCDPEIKRYVPVYIK